MRADAFGVAHFAEDAAVGGGDAFDGPDGAVGVVVGVHGGGAGEVGVLGGDLAVLRQVTEEIRRAEEAALAVGDGDFVEVVWESQGDLLETILVWTIFDWWRPMTL